MLVRRNFHKTNSIFLLLNFSNVVTPSCYICSHIHFHFDVVFVLCCFDVVLERFRPTVFSIMAFLSAPLKRYLQSWIICQLNWILSLFFYKLHNKIIYIYFCSTKILWYCSTYFLGSAWCPGVNRTYVSQ